LTILCEGKKRGQTADEKSLGSLHFLIAFVLLLCFVLPLGNCMILDCMNFTRDTFGGLASGKTIGVFGRHYIALRSALKREGLQVDFTILQLLWVFDEITIFAYYKDNSGLKKNILTRKYSSLEEVDFLASKFLLNSIYSPEISI
jgi:hypothetical protein